MVQDEELARTEHEEQVFLVNWVATEPRLTYRRRVGLCRPWPLAFQMCLSSRQALSGPRSIWNHVQAQRNASEVPERAVFLRGDRFRGGWGFQRVED